MALVRLVKDIEDVSGKTQGEAATRGEAKDGKDSTRWGRKLEGNKERQHVRQPFRGVELVAAEAQGRKTGTETGRPSN